MKRMPVMDPNELIEDSHFQNEMNVGPKHFKILKADAQFPEVAKASKSRTYRRRADIERFKIQVEQSRREEIAPWRAEP